MKTKLLYFIFWMLSLTQFAKAQISLSTGSSRNIEDFYGLNGQNTLSATSVIGNNQPSFNFKLNW